MNLRLNSCLLRVIRGPLRFVAVLSVLSLLFLGTGCAHNFPKDSYAEGVKSTINTPWGPSTFEARTLATGVAARNASTPDNVVPALKPIPRTDAP